MTGFEVLVAPPLGSPERDSPLRASAIEAGGDRNDRTVVVGAVQCAWHADTERHRAVLAEGIGLAAGAGASIVFLQELTLSPYFCVAPEVPDALERWAEDLESGPTVAFARECAAEHEVYVHASLYERSAVDHGHNTAVCVAPDGRIAARSRKTHIPAFPYYHEDRYFESSGRIPEPVEIGGVTYGFPTCWDQWFPELARAMSIEGAEVLVYPTAIGSEPHVPGFDSQPIWRHTMVAHAIANAVHVVAVNRIGNEGILDFYGSSFVADPYGRVIVEAPRDRPTVLVAELDLGQRADWASFGLLYTREPDTYGALARRSVLGRPIE